MFENLRRRYSDLIGGRRKDDPPVPEETAPITQMVQELDPLYKRAEELITKIEGSGPSGEYRRHQVYSRLLKEFPDRDKVDIDLCIPMTIKRLRARLVEGVMAQVPSQYTNKEQK